MLEEEIREAISVLKIEEEVKVFTGEEKNRILIRLKEIFVKGNPRVWWLSLKYKPQFFVFEEKYPYKKIVDFFNEKEDAWFVVEDEYNNGDQLLYKTKISYVIDIIGECSGFEYNIISDNFDRFLCENDHGAFLFIDHRKHS